MEVKHNLTLFLTSPRGADIDAVQGDGVRTLVCRLMSGALPWIVPNGVTAGISYELPGSAPGYYDTLRDGTPACTIEDNVVSTVLDPILTAQPGQVKISLILREGEKQVATFPMCLRVSGMPGLGHTDNWDPPVDGFAGKIYFGGEGGALIPLGVGHGIEIEQQEDGTLRLIAEGFDGVLEQIENAAERSEEASGQAASWSEMASAAQNSAWAAVNQAKHSAQDAQTAAENAGASRDTAVRAVGEAQSAAGRSESAAGRAEAAAQRAENAQETVSAAVDSHNTDLAAHPYFHGRINDLEGRLNTALNSDDTTLDQLSEIVAYIKSNKTLIDAITTSKVSVADIVDNLVTNVANKPLSAAQGVRLRQMAEDIRGLLAFDAGADGQLLMVFGGKAEPVQLGEGLEIRDGRVVPNAILHTPQTLTAEQRRTARDNIGAGQAIVCEAEGEVITLSGSADDKLRGLRIYGKTTQNGTPTPEAPVELVSVGASGSIGVNVMGKNLINLVPREIHNNKGIKFDAFDGGTRLKGTSTGEYAQNGTNAYRRLKLPEGKYTLKAHVEGVTDNAVFAVIIMRDGSTQYVGATFSQAVVKDFVIEVGHTYEYFVFIRESGKTVDCVVKAMLVPGTEAAEWEPYTAQTLTAQTPDGLPGIPVTSGGNYTDKNGQQWICDEIDFARGKYVQRVGKQTLTGANYWGKTSDNYFSLQLPGKLQASPIMCSRLPHSNSLSSTKPGWWSDNPTNSLLAITGYGDMELSEFKAYLNENPIDIVYGLITPVEADLTDEEITAFRALRTNKPNTTIYNDAGAGMEVEYVADTKAYIDKKFNDLAAALVRNT